MASVAISITNEFYRVFLLLKTTIFPVLFNLRTNRFDLKKQQLQQQQQQNKCNRFDDIRNDRPSIWTAHPPRPQPLPLPPQRRANQRRPIHQRQWRVIRIECFRRRRRRLARSSHDRWTWTPPPLHQIDSVRSPSFSVVFFSRWSERSDWVAPGRPHRPVTGVSACHWLRRRNDVNDSQRGVGKAGGWRRARPGRRGAGVSFSLSFLATDFPPGAGPIRTRGTRTAPYAAHWSIGRRSIGREATPPFVAIVRK